MTQLDSLFDPMESAARKREGMAVAAAARPCDLEIARNIARSHAELHGTVTADDVGRKLQLSGIDLGPAAGSIFKTAEWVFTGDFKKSARKTNHSRLLRVWRLK